MAHTFTLRHRVEFADTDMAGIIHFSSYFRYLEVTEHAFFRSLGFSVAGGEYGWPRVAVSCEYRHPLRFEEEVEVTLRVLEKRSKVIRYGFTFRRVAPEPVIDVASAELTVVCVTMDPESGTMKAARIPDALADQLEVAP